MHDLIAVWNHRLGPWSVGELVLALAYLLAAQVVRSIVVARLSRRLLNLASRTETKADDMAVQAVTGPLGTIVLLTGFYLALRLLAAGRVEIASMGDHLFKALLTVIVAWGLFRLVDAAAVFLSELARRSDSPLDDSLVPLLRKAGKLLIGILAFVLAAQNLGYSVSGLLAGLGLGGFAFALAAKDTIANLFGGVTILADRPFRAGDWITFDQTDGVVEEIGLRSTRIRTFAKTVVSVPNQTLANATVENHSLMPKRRVKQVVGVTYDTRPDQMRELVRRVEELLRGHPDVHQEFMLVKFTDFGPSSLDLLIYYFTATTDWERHLAVRQEINLAVMDIVAELGLSIAFPTQTVHLRPEAPLEIRRREGEA